MVFFLGGAEEGAEHVPLENHHEGVRGVAGVAGDERLLLEGAQCRVGVDLVQNAQLFDRPGGKGLGEVFVFAVGVVSVQG